MEVCGCKEGITSRVLLCRILRFGFRGGQGSSQQTKKGSNKDEPMHRCSIPPTYTPKVCKIIALNT